MSILNELSANLKFHLDLRQGSLRDLTATGNNVTLTGLAKWINTKYGKAIKFASTGRLVTNSNIDIDFSTDFTMECLVKLDSIGNYMFFNQYTAPNYPLVMGVNTGNLYYKVNDVIKQIATIIDSQTQYHYVTVYDATAHTLKGYLNGVWQGTLTSITFVDNVGQLNIGGRGANFTIDGNISLARCYDVALSDMQVSQLSAEVYLESHISKLPSRNFPSNNLLEDGDMENSGVGDWGGQFSPILTKENGTRTGGSGTQILRVAYGGTNNPLALQSTILTANTKYRATGWIRAGVGGNCRVLLGTAGVITSITSTSTDWVYFDIKGPCGNGILALQNLTTTDTYAEFDDIVVVPYNQPILDAGKIRPIYRNTFEDANVTLGTTGDDLNRFLVGSGTWKISEDSNGQKWLENVTAGVAYVPSDLAYGTFEFDLYKALDASNSYVLFMSTVAGIYGAATQNAYLAAFTSGERVTLVEVATGSGGYLNYSVGGYIVIATKYTLRVTRSKAGVFTTYIKGGTFENWTLVDVTGGIGTNPVTDTTTTTSKFFVVDFDAGDRISNIRMWKGVITP